MAAPTYQELINTVVGLLTPLQTEADVRKIVVFFEEISVEKLTQEGTPVRPHTLGVMVKDVINSQALNLDRMTFPVIVYAMEKSLRSRYDAGTGESGNHIGTHPLAEAVRGKLNRVSIHPELTRLRLVGERAIGFSPQYFVALVRCEYQAYGYF